MALLKDPTYIECRSCGDEGCGRCTLADRPVVTVPAVDPWADLGGAA